MMTPSKQLPTVGPDPVNESATSSTSRSRTATHATAAYEIAGYETPMASRTPPLGPSGLPSVLQFEGPSISLAAQFEIKITLDLGYPATLDLKIFNQFDDSRPIFSRFRDTAGGHDVVFCFPDRKHLYADRYVLQSASPFLRNLFELRNRESGIVPGVGVGIGAGIGQGKSVMLHEDGVGAVTRAGRGGRASERDITTLAGSTVITPMTSVHGDGVPDNIPLPLDTKGFMFQRTTFPSLDDNIFVMNIVPSPRSIRPMVPRPAKYPGTAKTRSEKHACRGVHEEVSESTRTGIAQVNLSGGEKAQALSRISTAIFNPLVATAELFSAFTRVHESIKQSQIQVVIDNWNEVVKTEDWAIAKEKGKAQPYVPPLLLYPLAWITNDNSSSNRDQYFAGVLCEILEVLLPRSA
ncbi:hypothetical protein FRC05_007715 [Tulasnella sp. 425]|nr:hypothetical protein FRC05_007715 [Tulasnella sp. 425]